jgi:hypothetical protein
MSVQNLVLSGSVLHKRSTPSSPVSSELSGSTPSALPPLSTLLLQLDRVQSSSGALVNTSLKSLDLHDANIDDSVLILLFNTFWGLHSLDIGRSSSFGQRTNPSLTKTAFSVGIPPFLHTLLRLLFRCERWICSLSEA